ncbi:MAG: YicC family protein [Ignavibacteriae bacterium]|jgi:uncharacterized protein (TIGR00255 family)|nr:YicC family protein [Ignavibacteriota bacterium]NOG97260.1 YicC family protein [Ignavibacteriota bacterium]
MISSMTGFGKGTASIGSLVAEAEIKSFNSRFLDFSIRVPRKIANREFEIRNLIKKEIKRGKLNLTVKIKKEGIDEDFVSLSTTDLNNTLGLIKKIKDTAKISDDITLTHLLSFQNSFINDEENDSEDEFKVAIEAIKLAIAELKKMRLEEGNELANDLRLRVSNIEKTTLKIEEQSRDSVDDYFGKLRDRAKQLTEDIVEYEDRLNAELALLAEKYDVTEEFVRLKSHIKLFLETLNNSDEAGRRLNFIMQEMNREVNTINSKTVSTEIAHYGIYLKEEIEKIREQIQNIE